MKTEENGQINRDKEFVRGSPKCLKKKICNFSGEDFMQHSSVFFLWITAAKDAHGETLPTWTSLSKDKKKEIKKGKCTVISP